MHRGMVGWTGGGRGWRGGRAIGKNKQTGEWVGKRADEPKNAAYGCPIASVLNIFKKFKKAIPSYG